MTLNINGIKGKFYELSMLLERQKPDIICLQETKVLETDKRIHINGYITHEVPASDAGLGLLMGFRKDSNLDVKIVESSPDVILASVNGRTLIGNVYRSPRSGVGVATASKVVDILSKYPDKCLLVGDWNETSKVLKTRLLRKGIQVHTTDAPVRGTRLGSGVL